MKREVVYLSIFLMTLVLIPSYSANPVEWHNMPKTDNEAGEIFQLRFEIGSDETTNYTITLEPGNQFSAIDGNLTMTKEIPVNATRTFIFDMKIDQDLEDGKHPIPFTAYKEGVEFKQGNVYVRAGQQTPGFEVILIISAFLLMLLFYKKKSG